MNDCLTASDGARQRRAVGHVAADPVRDPGPGRRLRAAERPYLSPPARQLVGGVSANEPARAREQDVHFG